MATRIDPDSAVFVILSFEGPDIYSQAGGLGVRVTELADALAEEGYETHLIFIGDPNEPANETRRGGKLHWHRWSQWLSRYNPNGVYQGEDDKVRDFNRSVPPWVVGNIARPAAEQGKLLVVLAEEWHTAYAVCELSDWLLRRRAARPQRAALERQQRLLVPPDRLGAARLRHHDHHRQPLHEASHVAAGRQPPGDPQWDPRARPGAGDRKPSWPPSPRSPPGGWRC